MAEDILTIAAGEIGSTESPAGSNRTRYGVWYGWNGVAWCMIFVQWLYAQAGRPLPYKTASCSQLLEWYRKNRPECIVTDPKPRDIVLYTFSHTGIVESVGASSIIAIEGNTSAGDQGSQSNGGGVFRRIRNKSLVKAYIRPFGEEMEEEMVDINKLLAEMTDEQAYTLLAKAQRYAATLPEPEWSQHEGHWQGAIARGIVNGGSPEGLLKRDEFTAVLGRAGLL